MPIIGISQADRLAAARVEAGWLPLEIVKCGDATASASKKSVTYEIIFRVLSGDKAGKEHSIFFNTEASSNNVLGNRQYVPVAMMEEIQTVLDGKKMGAGDIQIDTDTWLGKKLDGQFIVDIIDGSPQNRIVKFNVLGKGDEALPF